MCNLSSAAYLEWEALSAFVESVMSQLQVCILKQQEEREQKNAQSCSVFTFRFRNSGRKS